MDISNCFSGIYANKKILITGHTGFKGAWLSIWLEALGAKVTGYAIDIPTQPSLFEMTHLANKLTHHQGDVRDAQHLEEVIQKTEPDMVFHVAAQPIVHDAYDDPTFTFETNMLGTMYVLEAIRKQPSVKAAVLITSDKCYRNQEWLWGYREHDELGGIDPYSASKAGAELIARSYIGSFFQSPTHANIATARAGNVIGGGDWARARIIPDAVRAWSEQKPLTIRSPHATRPWQHVLEPLSGYLTLGAHLYAQSTLHGEPFNFGPQANTNQSVAMLLNAFSRYWPDAQWIAQTPASDKHESTLLKLSCDKALHHLQWEAVLNFEETIDYTAQWYSAYYDNRADMLAFTHKQIQTYVEKANQQGQRWASSPALLKTA